MVRPEIVVVRLVDTSKTELAWLPLIVEDGSARAFDVQVFRDVQRSVGQRDRTRHVTRRHIEFDRVARRGIGDGFAERAGAAVVAVFDDVDAEQGSFFQQLEPGPRDPPGPGPHGAGRDCARKLGDPGGGEESVSDSRRSFMRYLGEGRRRPRSS